MRSVQDHMRTANPVPAPEAAVDRLIYESILDKVMELEGRESSARVPPRWQAVRLAAAAVLLILAVGAGYLWGADQASVETLAGTSPTELALLYMDARNDADLASAQALFAIDSAVVEYPAIRKATELEDVFAYLNVMDERLAVLECASPPDRPEVVTCDYQMDNRLVAEARVEPIPGKMRFVIAGDRIAAVENEIDIRAYTVTALDPWFMWLDRNIDGGFASMYRWTFQLDRAVPTPRSERLEEIADVLDDYAPPG